MSSMIFKIYFRGRENYFMCLTVFACMYMCVLCVYVPHVPATYGVLIEMLGHLGTGVIDGYKSPCEH